MAIAYPFVQVNVDTSALTPIATRAPGVLAIVGISDGGEVGANVPKPVDDIKAAKTAFGDATALTRSLIAALSQSPAPSKIADANMDEPDPTTAGSVPCAHRYTQRSALFLGRNIRHGLFNESGAWGTHLDPTTRCGYHEPSAMGTLVLNTGSKCPSTGMPRFVQWRSISSHASAITVTGTTCRCRVR